MTLRRAYLWVGVTLDNLMHKVTGTNKTPLCKFTDDHFMEYFNPGFYDPDEQ
jgi:hypothetical protein